eukprot:GHRQ01018389.1.p1 GENE.GHRQ01018389.1~~GHRQ01018389.1.p1  ORF type:complete len:201 (+),score=56.31 GHRQ01018389.1:339-941(+)
MHTFYLNKYTVIKTVASMFNEVDECLHGLKAEKHLDRERALRKFQELISQAGTPAVQDVLVDGVKGLLASTTWEHKIGGLMAAKVLVDKCDISGFDDLMVREALRLLEDGEVRVRLGVGQLLRALASKRGVAVMEACQETVLNSITNHFVSTVWQAPTGTGMWCGCVGATAEAQALATTRIVPWRLLCAEQQGWLLPRPS